MLIGLAKTIGEGCLGFVKVNNVKEFIEYAKNTRLLHNEQKTWGDLDIENLSFVHSLGWGIWDSHGQLWARLSRYNDREARYNDREDIIRVAKKRLQDSNIKNENAPYFILRRAYISTDYDNFEEIEFDFSEEKEDSGKTELDKFKERAKSINLFDICQKDHRGCSVGGLNVGEWAVWGEDNTLWARANELPILCKCILDQFYQQKNSFLYMMLDGKDINSPLFFGKKTNTTPQYDNIRLLSKEVLEQNNPKNKDNGEKSSEELVYNVVKTIEKNRKDLKTQINLSDQTVEEIVDVVFKLDDEAKNKIKEIVKKEKERQEIDKELEKYETVITEWLKELDVNNSCYCYYNVPPKLTLTYQIIGAALFRIDFSANPTMNISEFLFRELRGLCGKKRSLEILEEYLKIGMYSQNSGGIITAVAKGVMDGDWSKLEEDLNQISNQKEFIAKLIKNLKKVDINDVFSKSKEVREAFPKSWPYVLVKTIEKAYIRKYCLGKDM